MRALPILIAIFCALAHAEEEFEVHPLLELGVGGGGGMLQDYPGSDQAHFHWAVFPVVFYHGKIFRSDRRDGVYARVVKKPRFGVDLSGGGYFPTDSADNRAREGMESLGWLGELGPRLYFRAYDEDAKLLRVFTFARGAVSAHANQVHARGALFGLGVGYDQERGPFTIFTKITAHWATQEYNDYFYTVTPRFATAERPTYYSEAGYLGTWVQAGASYEWPRWTVSAGLLAMSTKGSANEASPLFKEDLSLGVFAGVAWFFYKSYKMGIE